MGAAVVNFGFGGLAPACLYAAMILVFMLSVFWRPIVGLYFFVPLIPLQTVRYRITDFPLGASLVYVVLLGVALGLVRKGRPLLPKTPWTGLLLVYVLFTFVSLCLGSFYLDSPLPWFAHDRRFSDWCDYMTMPFLFLLVASAVTEARQIKIMMFLMCISVLMLDNSFWNTVSGHDFSTYSEDLREGGTMGYAGSNGLAAFEAQFATLLLAISGTANSRMQKLGTYCLAAFSAICLMYSLSRGGYLAFAAGCLFIGLVKQRKLLLAIILFAFTWTSFVPNAVETRVRMTRDSNGDLDHSSQTRVELWDDALLLIQKNPVLGTGYDTYRYMGRIGNYEDTHNIYLKILVETGVTGMALFLWLLLKSFWQGILLFKRATDPIFSGIGLGLAGWVICAAVASSFGDRWTYLQIEGLFWVLAGLAARCSILQEEAEDDEFTVGDSDGDGHGRAPMDDVAVVTA
jgi:O-antigen ligase